MESLFCPPPNTMTVWEIHSNVLKYESLILILGKEAYLFLWMMYGCKMFPGPSGHSFSGSCNDTSLHCTSGMDPGFSWRGGGGGGWRTQKRGQGCMCPPPPQKKKNANVQILAKIGEKIGRNSGKYSGDTGTFFLAREKKCTTNRDLEIHAWVNTFIRQWQGQEKNNCKIMQPNMYIRLLSLFFLVFYYHTCNWYHYQWFGSFQICRVGEERSLFTVTPGAYAGGGGGMGVHPPPPWILIFPPLIRI